jgi:hypothetical protein
MLFEAEPQALAALRAKVLEGEFSPILPSCHIWRFLPGEWEHLRGWCRELWQRIERVGEGWARGGFEMPMSQEERRAQLAQFRRGAMAPVFLVEIEWARGEEPVLHHLSTYPTGNGWAELVARSCEVGQRKIKLFYPLKSELDGLGLLLQALKLPQTVGFVEDVAHSRSTDDEIRVAWFASRQWTLRRLEGRTLSFDGKVLRHADQPMGVVYQSSGAGVAQWENLVADRGSVLIAQHGHWLSHEVLLRQLAPNPRSKASPHEVMYIAQNGNVESALAPVRLVLVLNGDLLKAAFYTAEASQGLVVGCVGISR